jgi:hypothetical protein
VKFVSGPERAPAIAASTRLGTGLWLEGLLANVGNGLYAALKLKLLLDQAGRQITF